jgi:hypothetical protein
MGHPLPASTSYHVVEEAVLRITAFWPARLPHRVRPGRLSHRNTGGWYSPFSRPKAVAMNGQHHFGRKVGGFSVNSKVVISRVMLGDRHDLVALTVQEWI